MIILDIDLDYFFLPVFSGILIPEDKKDETYYNAPVQPIDIISYFKLKGFDGEIKHLINHDEVYYDLKKMNIKNNNLIHIDAHDDVEHSTVLRDINLGNWITHLVLEDLISPEVFWINQQTEKPYRKNYKVFNKDYYLNTSQLHDFNLKSKIDLIYITKSIEFCPSNSIANILESSIRYL